MARNKYHLKTKSGNKEFRKNNDTNKTWLKTRHRVRQKLLR